jgi:hypothetical protein
MLCAAGLLTFKAIVLNILANEVAAPQTHNLSPEIPKA